MAAPATVPGTVIEAAGLAKRYGGGVVGLRGLDLTVAPGELVGVLGPSGSGKTTLFRLLVGALRPSSGRLSVLGQDLGGARSGELRRLRRRLALIYQQHNLVPSLSVAQNVLLGRLGRVPLWRALGWLVALSAAERAAVFAVLDELGIGHKLYTRVDQLSGGEQQRVAIARAVLDPPALLIADEPIASVDAATATLILDRFRRLNRDHGTTVVVSVHQADFARRYCPRVLVLSRGVLVYDGPPAEMDAALARPLAEAAREQDGRGLPGEAAEGRPGAAPGEGGLLSVGEVR